MKTSLLLVLTSLLGVRPHEGSQSLSIKMQEEYWQPPLVLEHDIPSNVRLKIGDTLVVHLALRNVSKSRIKIGYGSPAFVLEAHWWKRDLQSASGGPRRAFPSHQSWGSSGFLEFPNPESAYTAELVYHTLAPGERYTPALIYERDAYHVPFDSAGLYRIRVCADLVGLRLCTSNESVVSVS